MKTKSINIIRMHLPAGHKRRPGVVRRVTKAAIFHWPAWEWQPYTLERQRADWLLEHSWGGTQHVVDVEGRIGEFMPPEETAYAVGSLTDWETGAPDARANRAYTPWAQQMFGRQFIQHRAGRTPNFCTINAEIGNADSAGRMTETTLSTAVDLFAWYCQQYQLDPFRHIGTHQGVTGKDCPRWFVNYPHELWLFRERVAQVVAEYTIEPKYEEA